ncbi:hypothetical protein RclHR1_06900005 [Rhizophagus clarus]|uniref:Protein kinase domain-containing protein n=1 Tax=Rhizophagus clarus TaxID=94130 RepID=A0A2Z6SBE9_9GLOM|nr:hypothetical protein RclHR1_06900005 [Rhizophagus clarus]
MDSFLKSVKKLVKSHDCDYRCNAKWFKQNFNNWTSGNKYIDKFIQNTQLSAHYNYSTITVLEWIPYDRFYNIRYLTGSEIDKVYSANWIDGNIDEWNEHNQNWRRNNQNMFVTLKNLSNSASITLKFINEITEPYKIYGITQDPETKSYMAVLNIGKCEKCNNKCNALYFQYNFDNWTSGNDDIDKLIQNTQLLAHDYSKKTVLEWIPYDRFYNIRYLTENEIDKVYSANWIDGNIDDWNTHNQNWRKNNQNMFVTLKNLSNSASITLKFINEITEPYKIYGITQNPETKNYIIVLDTNKCKNCENKCNAIYFQYNFNNWTSGNNDIDKFIQGTQLSDHNYNKCHALEWIPYNKFRNIKYIAKSRFGKVYKANWIDGYMDKWDNNHNNWERKDQNMLVILKNLYNSANITLKFINEITELYKIYGITQNPETNNYMVVLDAIKCKNCNNKCNAVYFQYNFNNWTSGNNDIDKFIQDTQLSDHNYNKCHALEWIPYNKFRDIKYIAKGGFGKVYKANWIDGYMDKWDDNHNSWKRKDQNMLVALKSLNNSKNVTLEFMNEITLHYKVNMHKSIIRLYGITQEPQTGNYIMVLDYAENGNLRDYLNTSYNELSWNNKLNYLHSIAHGLKNIHEKELIHRDLHIGNILRLRNVTCITDMGLCKPADYDASENTKNKTYGVLPYIAPEILRGQNYAETADIYSFGIIMYEVISGLPPYHDVSHDCNLAIRICKGLRPRFNIKVPQLIVQLIKKCLDANPLNRPKAGEIKATLSQLFRSSHQEYVSDDSGIKEQIEEAERINNKLSTGSTFSISLGISYETHSEAIYTSRLLDFDNLPQPKNSDDYYEVRDNIISMKFSDVDHQIESLQIDTFKLNYNNLDLKNSDNTNTESSEGLQIDIPEPENPVDYYEENNNIINMESSESLQIDISQLNINEDE